MSSMSTELFESLTQPLRAAQISTVGMTMGDIQLLEESEKIPSKVAVELPLKKEGQNIQIQEKMGELIALEKNHLEFMKKVLAVLSDPDFQAIFSENQTEEKIIGALAGQLQIYFEFHLRNIKKPLDEVDQAIDKTLSQIGVLYSRDLLSVQKTLILAFARLFSLGQIFTNERNREKITALIEKKFNAIKMTDQQGIIETGQLSSIFMQTIIRRKMLLEEFYIATSENDPSHSEITRVYTSLAEHSWEANNVMDGANVIKREVNQDRFCLRKVLCDEECFKKLGKIAAKDPEKGPKRVKALNFLRQLSILIQENEFLEDTRAANTFTYFELNFNIDEKRKFKQLAEGPVRSNLEIISPILREFVQSQFFIDKANLSRSPEETEETYRERLNRLAVRGELIKLYQQESRKEEKREETLKGKEEESKGESAERQQENISRSPSDGMQDQNIMGEGRLPSLQRSTSAELEEALPELVDVDVRNFAPSAGIGIEEKQGEIKEPIVEEKGERKEGESEKEEQDENNSPQSKEMARDNSSDVRTSLQQCTAPTDVQLLRQHSGGEGEPGNIEPMEIVAPSSHAPSLHSNLVVQYLSIAAEKVGDFVRKEPATAMALAMVSCIAIGVVVSTAGAGLVVAAAVAGAAMMGFSAVGTWCAFYSLDSASTPERSSKLAENVAEATHYDYFMGLLY